MNTIRSVQCLRAIAAAMVMLGHVISELEFYFQVNLGLRFIPWTAGVDIFFVISGFVIFLLAHHSRQESSGSNGSQARRFLLARIIRLTPLYYLFTTLIVVTLLVTPSSLNSAQFEPGQILGSYLFFPNMRHDGQIIPVLSVGWTLNYEMFFYALFGLGIALFGRYAACFVSLVLVALIAAGQIFHFDSSATVFWTKPILLEFMAGILIAWIYISTGHWRQKLAFWPALIVFCLGFVFLSLGPEIALKIAPAVNWPSELAPFHRVLYFGLPACLIVISATTLMPDRFDKKCPELMVSLGNSSYALYLSHRFTLRLLSFIWISLIPSSNNIAMLITALIATVFGCLTVAHLVYLRVEKPLLARLKGYTGVKSQTQG